jgi:TPP-dependent pyruvate/acetoin dehydrogenase alpha subunit
MPLARRERLDGSGELETIDEHFVRVLRAHTPTGATRRTATDEAPVDMAALHLLFEAQAQSRHLDFAARWLQSQGEGYYTIGSAGHESNAALGLLSRVTDPALLHYRSGGFYAARAGVAGRSNPIRDVLLSLTSARNDPMSGGRHKVFGHRELNIISQTSTIGSHLPRAVGLAYALRLSRETGVESPWLEDAVVLCSFGDTSANHSTATGPLNAACYLAHRDIPCPVLFVCKDNGIGISTRSPRGWPAAALQQLPGLRYWHVDGADPASLLTAVPEALAAVRDSRRAAVARYRTRDLLEDGDGEWTAPYVPPGRARPSTPPGEVRLHGDGRDVLLVTFGNGVHLSRRAAAALTARGVTSTVLDLRWLAPLPVAAVTAVAHEFTAVLVVDETRHSGGISEGVVAAWSTAATRGGCPGSPAPIASSRWARRPRRCSSARPTSWTLCTSSSVSRRRHRATCSEQGKSEDRERS